MDPSPGDPTLEMALRNAEALFGGLKMQYVLAIGIFIVTTAALALLAWRLHYAAVHGRGAMAFLRFLFPRSIYLHRSTWVDVQLIAINQLFSPITLAITAFATGLIASLVSQGLFAVFPEHNPDFQWSFLSLLGFTAMLAVVSDLGTYIVHRLHHTVPALWEIHKVHHSAEVMSPLTIFRKHPFFDLAARLMKAAMMGPLQGVVFFIWAGPVGALTAFGTNLVFSIFHMFGAGLRHSHVWLSYGPLLEHIFISPAQHQIHHSTARRHWDKNFGQMFAFWDWAFGSLYVPKGHEELRFGIDGGPVERFLRPDGRAGPPRRACDTGGDRPAEGRAPDGRLEAPQRFSRCWRGWRSRVRSAGSLRRPRAIPARAPRTRTRSVRRGVRSQRPASPACGTGGARQSG